MSNITLPDLPSLEGGVFFHFIFLTFPIIETSVSDPDLHRSALSDTSRNKTGSCREKKQSEKEYFFTFCHNFYWTLIKENLSCLICYLSPGSGSGSKEILTIGPGSEFRTALNYYKVCGFETLIKLTEIFTGHFINEISINYYLAVCN